MHHWVMAGKGWRGMVERVTAGWLILVNVVGR